MTRGAQRSPTRIAVHGTGRMARALAAAAADGNTLIVALVGPQPPEWETTAAWVSDLGGLPGLKRHLRQAGGGVDSSRMLTVLGSGRHVE